MANNFLELGIDKDFVKGINELGIKEPTQIQERAIPLLLEGNTDMVGQAQTGTGKTAAYGLPLLQRINPKNTEVQALILCPTRELGQQVAKQLFKFTKYSDRIFTESVYGGAKIDQQISNLKRTTHIIVATPGRLIDLSKRGAVDLSTVKTIVMDEADEILSLGFKKELDQVLTYANNARNKWLFSATLPHGIKQIINKHLSPNAHHVQVNSKSVVNKNIEHKFLVCDERDKLHVLFQFLKSEGENRGVIFCRTKDATKTLTKQLQAKNFKVDGIQGDMKQTERDKVMRAFKNESINYLVATDLAARGIDVKDLSFVVHYQLPDKDEYYTHRSGRTARAGQKGISLCIVTSKEMRQLKFLERKLKIGFKQIRKTR